MVRLTEALFLCFKLSPLEYGIAIRASFVYRANGCRFPLRARLVVGEEASKECSTIDRLICLDSHNMRQATVTF